MEAPYSDAAETNAVGGLTLDGFLSLVRISMNVQEHFILSENGFRNLQQARCLQLK